MKFFDDIAVGERFELGRHTFDAESIKNFVAQEWQSTDGLSTRIITSLRMGGLALAGIIGNLVLIPLVLFYLLDDWPLLISSIGA